MYTLPMMLNGNDLLKIMLSNLAFLYPNHFGCLEKRIKEQNINLSESSFVLNFAFVNYIAHPIKNSEKEEYFRFSFFEESPRPMASCPERHLPKRIVFRGPYIQITYEGAHTRLDDKKIAGRLFFEFFDAVTHDKAHEKVCFIFTIDGHTGLMKYPRLKTTQAFRAFDTHTLEDFQMLQPFIFVMMCEHTLANLLRLLINDLEKYYAVNDERPHNLRRLKAVFETPAPAFELPS